MARHWFSRPVPVRMRESRGLRLTVHSVEVATEELLKWPKRGPEWSKAVGACMAALEDKASPDDARKAFAIAAKEAAMLFPPL